MNLHSRRSRASAIATTALLVGAGVFFGGASAQADDEALVASDTTCTVCIWYVYTTPFIGRFLLDRFYNCVNIHITRNIMFCAWNQDSFHIWRLISNCIPVPNIRPTLQFNITVKELHPG